ncbi:MAG: formate dehydrogenase [Rhodospirillales bacterium]|nr:formate dehydrogenase [Rhodospirillales bacterium]
MLENDDSKRQSARRGFLKLGIGSVAGGAALVAGGLASAPAQAAKPAPKGGYAETDHVKAYYDSARF